MYTTAPSDGIHASRPRPLLPSATAEKLGGDKMRHSLSHTDSHNTTAAMSQQNDGGEDAGRRATPKEKKNTERNGRKNRKISGRKPGIGDTRKHEDDDGY
eukprot:GHVT01025285.1.p3 GENE.GHVT01025285.1~~GHVT01025285.1.p3  ORF type:complete len:100 (-),score=20.14 GHVT01025285.1:566-865(-)